MNKCVMAVKAALISPEMLVVLMALFWLLNVPEFLSSATDAASTAPQAVKYVSLIPAGVLVWSITEAKSILFPAEDAKGVLVSWPRYGELRQRVVIGLLFNLTFAVMATFLWVAPSYLSEPREVILTGMSILGSVVCASTLLTASLTVRAIAKNANT